ncbi:MAG: hypothetical protein UX25_C0024G0003 [Candidatus Woesebacteria bacterium GW2011_GWC2_45_9]|uniref:Nucleotidyl transferase AbiEii/AbiGii toxin family protein n=1 Tax=Candidatus Woesebacteria bacterium GW2011_GWC2_45_9 TaxID=1618589 RepID=A0A0G1N8G0_9BACT|nr:MAG: hypothetical protein UX25_C0024G0003 [Candidatus Woesebacteria bacterium GW2011_GWC2_45_9]
MTNKMRHKNLLGFYHNLITDKSWKMLILLRKSYDFILIGGWAVYLYTKVLKSKDIDIVVGFDELERLKHDFEVSKNVRLKKYEARAEEIEIDIYVPFYSSLGVPTEDLKKYETQLTGFKVPSKEVLAALKEYALTQRADSPKGRKDLIDIVSLFSLPDFNWKRYKKIVKEYGLESFAETTGKMVKETTQIQQLGLNNHKMASLKRKIVPLI